MKACIANQTQAGDFPDLQTVRDSYVHDLKKLVPIAGVTNSRNDELNAVPAFKVNWLITKDWSEVSRYQRWTDTQSRDLVLAVSDETFGVLSWLRRHW